MPDYTHAKRIIEALASGKELQFGTRAGWISSALNSDPNASVRIGELNNTEIYRIKPEPKLIPLSQEDIPPVCWIRSPNQDSMWLVTHTETENISYNFNGSTYKWMFDEGYHYSTDRKNWKPCSKLEGV